MSRESEPTPKGNRVARRRLVLILSVLLLSAAAGAGWLAFRTPHSDLEQQFRRGLTALERGDEPALTAALDALERAPDFEPHFWLLQGGRFLRAGQSEAALRCLAHTRPTGELREPALHLTGECLYRLGRVAEAESLFRDLLAEHPEHAEAHRWLAVISYDLGAMNHALTHLAELARLRDDDYTPHRLAGRIHLDFQRYPEAAEAYRRCLARHPPPHVRREAVVHLARALIPLREYAEAEQVLRELADDAEALALRAEAVWSLGEQDRAEELVAAALRLAPEDRTSLYLLGRMRLAAGEAAEAIPPLQQVLTHRPHDYEARYQLALAYQRLGRAAEAERETERMQQDFARYERMTALSRRAIESPRDAEVREELAKLCEELDRPELAEVWRAAAAAARQYADVQTPVRRPERAESL